MSKIRQKSYHLIMSLNLVNEGDCSTKGGTRKIDREKLEFKEKMKNNHTSINWKEEAKHKHRRSMRA